MISLLGNLEPGWLPKIALVRCRLIVKKFFGNFWIQIFAKKIRGTYFQSSILTGGTRFGCSITLRPRLQIDPKILGKKKHTEAILQPLKLWDRRSLAHQTPEIWNDFFIKYYLKNITTQYLMWCDVMCTTHKSHRTKEELIERKKAK